MFKSEKPFHFEVDPNYDFVLEEEEILILLLEK